MTQYAELHCHSYFSLLDGASSPEDLVAQAHTLGLHALALTDHDSLAGAIRFSTAARRHGLHPIIGAEVTLASGHHLTLLAETQPGYANLCRLITASRLDQIKHLNQSPLPPSALDAPKHLNQSPLSVAERPVPSGRGGEVAWPGKVTPAVTWENLATHSPGLIVLSGCRRGPLAAPLLAAQPEQAQTAAARLLEIFGPQHCYLELQHHYLPDDDRLIGQLLTLARAYNLQPVATSNVHYATPAASPLRDALIAIDRNQTLSAARQAGALPLNSNYALPTPSAMTQRFRHLPAALTNTRTIADRCHVSLDFSGQRLPAFPLPPPDPTNSAFRTLNSEFEYLYHLCHSHLPQRYPQLTPLVLKQLAHELDVIARVGLAGYFLIIWDVVRFAREAGIRCQGRGSAANSLVAYLLHITNIDPLHHNLLFERFLSADKFTMPDIDIDFAADRREEVIQYVYQKYGHAHTAMVCNVVTYQARSALRDLGKALAFPEPVIDRLAQSLDTHSCTTAADHLTALLPTDPLTTGSLMTDPLPTAPERSVGQQQNPLPSHSSSLPRLGRDRVGLAVTDPLTSNSLPTDPLTSDPLTSDPLALLATLLRQLDGCPRHLSIHSGGLIITGPPLAEIVPLEPATMPGRIITQWDKESIEDAGLIKIDFLSLRTLGLISAALHYIAQSGHQPPDLTTIALDDPALYRLLQRGDTIGTFQVESRAQQQMLPRLKPTSFAEIAVQIAIIRPGPIQGGAVHPYLRRRSGLEPVSYLHPTVAPVLHETLGVLLYQEQAIRLAMTVAGFTPGAADLLRRALTRKHGAAALQALATPFVAGAQQQGVDEPTARALFAQLAAFAGYGFPKSHAMSFALIAYQTLYLKHYHPAAFYCALLNQQPMGFYSPEVVINDARRHGVSLLPPDVNVSGWNYSLERRSAGRWALRTGLQGIPGLGPQGYARLAGTGRPFADLADLCRRSQLTQAVISNLIRAGALDGLAEGAGQRRQLLWQLGEIDYRPATLDLPPVHTLVDLPALEPLEQSAWEYELLGLSPSGQVLRHYRPALRRAGVLSVWEVKSQKAGQRARVAGLVVVRQRPATANGILFLSLEDESGLLDVVVKPELYQQFRSILRGEPLVIVTGLVQRAERAVSVLLAEVEPLTAR